MPDEPTRYHVLIADVSPRIAEEVRGTLEQAGIEVSQAATAAEALSIEECFSAAIVGVAPPGAPDRALLRDLSRRGVPCIALAEAPTLERVIEIAGLALHGLLVPPVAPEALLDVVNRAAEQRRLQAEVESERLHSAQLLGILQTIDTIQDRINNPLQSLLGFAELLTEVAGRDPEETRFFAGRVGEAARRVADVVGKLRRVRRPATQKWSFGETLDLDAAAGPIRNRRAHARSISVMLARIPTGAGGEGRWYFGEDISEGGCAISSIDELVLPDEVDVELADPESGETYFCKAQRVWHDAAGAYAGLRFLTVDPRLAERLRPAEGEGESEGQAVVG